MEKGTHGPGPGSYNITKKFELGRIGYRKPNSTFPKANRFKGPRIRNHRKKNFFGDSVDKKKKNSFSRRLNRGSLSKRMSQSMNDGKYDSSPGPGEYDISHGGIGTGFSKKFDIEDLKYQNPKSVARRYEGKF